MYRLNHKRQSVLFMTFLVIGMVLFASIGATFAYFQIEKIVTGTFKIGSVGASWYNGSTLLTNSSSYELALNRELTRGDTDGTYITNVAGTANGDINIKPVAGAESQYLRIKTSATIGKNLFDASKYGTKSGDGITAEYLEDEDCFLLNGTSTNSTKVGGYLYINLEGSINSTYTVSTTYVSGNISCPSGKHAVAYFGQSNTENTLTNWTCTTLATSNTSQSSQLTAKYISAFWFYFSSGVTLENYKVKVQLEKSSTATRYESYIEETDVTEYLTYRYIIGSNTLVVGSNNWWKKGTDGYYYFIDSLNQNQFTNQAIAYVFNNIVLSGEFKSEWLGRSIRITFKFESLQSANNPVVGIWGTPAANALGLS